MPEPFFIIDDYNLFAGEEKMEEIEHKDENHASKEKEESNITSKKEADGEEGDKEDNESLTFDDDEEEDHEGETEDFLLNNLLTPENKQKNDEMDKLEEAFNSLGIHGKMKPLMAQLRRSRLQDVTEKEESKRDCAFDFSAFDDILSKMNVVSTKSKFSIKEEIQIEDPLLNQLCTEFEFAVQKYSKKVRHKGLERKAARLKKMNKKFLLRGTSYNDRVNVKAQKGKMKQNQKGKLKFK